MLKGELFLFFMKITCKIKKNVVSLQTFLDKYYMHMKRALFLLLLTLTATVCSHADTFIHKTPSYDLHFRITNDSFEPYTVELYSTRIEKQQGGVNIVIPESINFGAATYCVTSISNKAFNYNAGYVTSVVIPYTITSIEERTFSRCHNLASIAIPNSITSIGPYAFHGTCWYNKLPDGAIYINNLLYAYKGEMSPNTSIKVKEGTTKILEGTFQNCKNLTAIALPQSLTTIGKDAFNGCSSLTSVVVPKNIKRIENGCFSNCTSLAFVLLPKGLFFIGGDAFSNCTSLTSITIPGTVQSIGGEAAHEYAFKQIGDSILHIRHKRVAGSAFRNCTSLASVTISKGVRRIENNAFEGCTALNSIRIPNSVFTIGAEAFKDCNALTDIQFGDSLRYVGYKAFHTTPWYKNLPDGEVYIGKTLYAYKGEMLTPTAIKIQDSTITITKGAFTDCNKLTNIRFPNTLETIEDSAFYGCSALSTILLPNSLQEVGWEAFKNCSSLDSIRLPDSLTNVGWEAFHGTPWYEKQTDGVVYINDIAYSYKGSMQENTSVELRDGTKSIAAGAFLCESNLSAITIPQSMQDINCFAFYRCKSLTSITCMAAIPPVCEALVFEEVPNMFIVQTCLYVPNNAIEEYKQDVDWRKFTQIKGIMQETE